MAILACFFSVRNNLVVLISEKGYCFVRNGHDRKKILAILNLNLIVLVILFTIHSQKLASVK